VNSSQSLSCAQFESLSGTIVQKRTKNITEVVHMLLESSDEDANAGDFALVSSTETKLQVYTALYCQQKHFYPVQWWTENRTLYPTLY
jgi:hypothetical protein